MKFYHHKDPAAPVCYRWPFCYLHGDAEEIAGRALPAEGPDDHFVCDSPMPLEPGEYRGTLYGKPLVMVITKRFNVGRYAGSDWLGGRGALEDDVTALEHCRKPEDWR